MSIPESGILQTSPSGYPGNGTTLDLTPYLDVQPGDGLDPANPQYTSKVWARSLLREGGTLALENLQLREMVFPLRLNATSRDAVADLVIPTTGFVNYESVSAASAGRLGWQLVDLGTINVPSSMPAATLAIQIWSSFEIGLQASGAGTIVFDLTDVMLLPDGQTTFVNSSDPLDAPWVFHFDGINNESFNAAANGGPLFRETPIQRGAIPKVPVGASPQIAAVLLGGASSVLSQSPAGNSLVEASVTVRERVRFSF